MEDGRKATIPAIHLNSSDSDDKLENLAQNLGDYINNIHSACAKSKQGIKRTPSKKYMLLKGKFLCIQKIKNYND